MVDDLRFCRYCGDDRPRKSWEQIGGTIGERHYTCHRKRCQRAHLDYLERARAARLERKALLLKTRPVC